MKRAVLIIFLVFISMQFIQTNKTTKQTDKSLEIQAPEHIMAMFKKACYDCHSNETKWPWYSNIAPFSWMISRNVNNGRKALNLSQWALYDEEKKKKKLKDIFRTAYASMPLEAYKKFHEQANLTKDERTQIRDWTGVKK